MRRFRICLKTILREKATELLEMIPESASNLEVECCFMIASRHVTAVLEQVADQGYELLQIVPVAEEPGHEEEEAKGDEDDEDEDKRPKRPRRRYQRRKPGKGVQLILRHVNKSSEPVDRREFSVLFERRGLSPSNVTKILRDLVKAKEILQVDKRTYKRKES